LRNILPFHRIVTCHLESKFKREILRSVTFFNIEILRQNSHAWSQHWIMQVRASQQALNFKVFTKFWCISQKNQFKQTFYNLSTLSIVKILPQIWLTNFMNYSIFFIFIIFWIPLIFYFTFHFSSLIIC
jgi:hypothetical protein